MRDYKEYQEAMGRLVNDDYDELAQQMGDSPSTILYTSIQEQRNYDFDIIEELVEKEKPMKPIKLFGSAVKCCPNCKMPVELRFDKPHDNEFYHCNYCPRCKQRLDWSE
jgi:hypothetical protein